MRMINKIIINKPVNEVWKFLADEFIPLEKWMAAITHTEEKKEGVKISGARTIGWKGYIGALPGAYMDETITMFDEVSMKFSVHTTVKNGPPAPLRGFDYIVSVVAISDNQSEVTWNGKWLLKPLGYFLYPVIKKGLSAWFYRGLEELKNYLETGKPHPRTLEKRAKWKEEGLIK